MEESLKLHNKQRETRNAQPDRLYSATKHKRVKSNEEGQLGRQSSIVRKKVIRRVVKQVNNSFLDGNDHHTDKPSQIANDHIK